MPHGRHRYAAADIHHALKYSGAVGVLGQRQVGKTTVVSELSGEYTTLDREGPLADASRDPENFIKNRKLPFGIDECQLCPPVFPAIKEHLRVHPQKGQFLLTGSVRFTSRKAIRESLTGRIVNIEVLPFPITEIYSENLSENLSKIAALKNNKDLDFFKNKNFNTSQSRAERYLATGGLPGICFLREQAIRNDKFEAHLETLLNRDLQLILKTSILYPNLRSLLEYLAKNQGKPFEISEAASVSQISRVTLKKILYAMEGIFLIRPVACVGTARKGTFFLEDQGMASWLMGKTTIEDAQDIDRLLYANLRCENHYGRKTYNKIFQYRTRDGAFVPLVFEFHQKMVGVISTPYPVSPAKVYGSADSFLKAYPKAKVVIAHRGSEISTRNFKIFQMPYTLLAS